MAYPSIYKNVGIDLEPSYGASRSGISDRLHVRTVSLGLDPTKSVIEDTMATVKGRDRIIAIKNDIKGDITGFCSPRELHYALQLANGTTGASATLGVSAITYTYNQNTSGTMLSAAINLDRNNSQEKFTGVVAQSLEITAADNIMEFTLTCIGKTKTAGASMTDILGSTLNPYTFADTTVYISQGASYANAYTALVSEWNVKYENGVEGTWLSGSKNINRVDPKVPSVTGKIKIMHEGASWTDMTFGDTESYIRFDSVLPSAGGLINGATPYILRIDIPRAVMKTNVRNYEQASLAFEEIEFEGLVNYGNSALWIVSQSVGTVL